MSAAEGGAQMRGRSEGKGRDRKDGQGGARAKGRGPCRVGEGLSRWGGAGGASEPRLSPQARPPRLPAPLRGGRGRARGGRGRAGHDAAGAGITPHVEQMKGPRRDGPGSGAEPATHKAAAAAAMVL